MSYPCVPPVPSIIAPLMQYCKRHHVYHKHISFIVFCCILCSTFLFLFGTTLFDSGIVRYSFLYHLSTAVQHALYSKEPLLQEVHITACHWYWSAALQKPLILSIDRRRVTCRQSTIHAPLDYAAYTVQYMLPFLMQKVPVKAMSSCHMPVTFWSTWAWVG